jgi:glycosyltransferase involved in cell wall biosynthesis
MPEGSVTVVLPCLNEAESLPGVLAKVPLGYRALVVDNNSTDDTALVARRHGAQVITERRPGYGSAVHAGIVAATTPIVAVLDADGSLDPAELPLMVAELENGADMVIGRRRPVRGLRWPWHARLGTAAVSWRLRTRHHIPVHCCGWASRTAVRGTRSSCWSVRPQQVGAWWNATWNTGLAPPGSRR